MNAVPWGAVGVVLLMLGALLATARIADRRATRRAARRPVVHPTVTVELVRGSDVRGAVVIRYVGRIEGTIDGYHYASHDGTFTIELPEVTS